MMSKKARWPDSVVNANANKPRPKKTNKFPECAENHGVSGRSGARVGRSNSLCSRDSSSRGKSGGSAAEPSHMGLKDNRSAGSQSSRPGSRLCSSRSFSSFSAAPFIRSSRALNGLEQKARDGKCFAPGNFSTSLETLSKDSPLNTREEMKSSLSSEALESSSVATCHNPSNNVKKQTRDGVYTLCAMTSGMRRNWVQAVLRNVRPNATLALTDSITEKHLQEPDQPSEGVRQDKANVFNDHREEDPNLAVPSQEHEANPGVTWSVKESPHGKDTAENPSDLFVPNTQSDHSTETATRREEHSQQPINNCPPCAKSQEEEKPNGELLKELEKTQKELSRLQQINRRLQEERATYSNEMSLRQKDLSSPASSLEQLQKVNQELLAELEAQRRSQEEAREAELRRRVDLLAQQAQLLVTGDATTLAQAQLELDRRRFEEKQLVLEQSLSSLKSQLQSSEEKRAEAESHLAQVQEELQGLHDLQQEANQLRKDYQEVTSQLRVYEETQAQKEARLEKHLMLLQASQERERKSLAASLADAEKRSQDLQEQLRRAEEQVESLNKDEEWTREIQEAQEQLQEELQQTVCAMQELQEDKDQLEHQCQELQNQLSESNKEVSRLQGRLHTDETQFYNLEHSYETVCEELQVALGKVLQWETEAQEMREGYERQLDQKEQELTEVLLKMEVLGNSLEDTETRLNEVLKDKEVEKKRPTTSADHVHVERLRSRSIDCSATADDPERFASVIQLLETKLYVTEEKLRDITQRLEDYQSHGNCQDPLLCSQLTQTRANAQHLSLLLHSQAKHNQRFAQDMENRCRMLVGRFQVALNIVQACRGRLQEAGSLINVEDFEKQLVTLVNCLQQGEKDAEKQQHESRHACKEEERTLNDKTLADSIHLLDDASESVGTCLSREIFVVETMVTMLQSKNVVAQLKAMQKENEETLSQRYQSLQTQVIALKVQSRNDESVESVVSSACVEAELVYKVFKFQQQSSNLSTDKTQPSELDSYERNHERRQTKSDEDKKCLWVEELISVLKKREAFLHQLRQDIPEVKTHQSMNLKWIHEHAKCIFLMHRLYIHLKQESHEHQCMEQEAKETLGQLEDDNCLLREELREAEQRLCIVETGNQRLLEGIQKIESYHEERMQKLEKEFQEKIQELQKIHEEEMKHLHDYYSKCFSKEKPNKAPHKAAPNQSHGDTTDTTEDKTEDLSYMRFSAMEEIHKKLINDLQQQHQKEVSKVLKEKDQLLKEETAATMAAIVAMRRAHKEELERTRRCQNTKGNPDVSQLHIEYEKELQSLNKDLEMLSVQHTQKCLENSQLSQELQELKKKKLSQNTKAACSNGADFYEMEVIVRAKEAEMQFLRQEAMSLKEELKLARMDTIDAQNKLRSLCMGTAEEMFDHGNKCSTGSPAFSAEAVIDKDKAAVENKNGRLSISRGLRAVRSKSLREGLSVQDRMKFFES